MYMIYNNKGFILPSGFGCDAQYLEMLHMFQLSTEVCCYLLLEICIKINRVKMNKTNKYIG